MVVDPLIMVAPNGARKNKADHPAVPIRCEELAATAQSCFAAGARAFHLHVRDANGDHSLDPQRYHEAIVAIKEAAPEMSVQITTESAGKYDVCAQYACLKAVESKWASISIREMERDTATAHKLYTFASEAGIKVQHILYSIEDMKLLQAWYSTGVIPVHLRSVIFVLGRYNPAVSAQVTDLEPFVLALKNMHLEWMLCAFGPNELAFAVAAVTKGGSIRIGFENNLHMPNGALAENNAQLIGITKRAVDMINAPTQKAS